MRRSELDMLDGTEDWSALPVPEILPVRTMLEELETVNVLAPLVRCSKREPTHDCHLM